MENLNDKTEMLKKIATINAVTGFDPTPFTIEFMDCESGETRRRIPVNTQLAWFRLLYPKGKIAVTTKRINGTNGYEATARVYMDYKDEPEHFWAEGTAQRTQSEKMSEYSIIEWAQTAALGVALRNAGFGLQFAVIGDGTGVLDEKSDKPVQETEEIPQEKPRLRKRKMKTPEPPMEAEADALDVDEDGVVLEGVEEDDAVLEGVEEDDAVEDAYLKSVMKAKLIPVPLTRYTGKTLGDLIIEDPKTLLYLANNERYAGEVKDGATLLCEYAAKSCSAA